MPLRAKSRVGIVGPRDWPDELAWGVELVVQNCLERGELISTGDCPTGVDAYVIAYCNAHNHTPRSYIADWTKFGKRAGPFRNGRLVRHVDRLIAFWDGKSAGTKDCIMQAIEVGIPIGIMPLRHFMPNPDTTKRHRELMDREVFFLAK